MRILTPAHLPPVEAGYLNLNLTHQAPRHTPSFPPHPVVILMGVNSRLESPYTSSGTPTCSNTFTATSYGLTNTSATSQGNPLRRPQMPPHLSLSLVRNIVAVWKSHSASLSVRTNHFFRLRIGLL